MEPGSVTLVAMRKSLSILLLSSLIFTGTELHQLARLPHLAHHFLDHQKEEPGMGLFAFLSLHYFSGQVHAEDFGQDEQLPFRSHDTHITFCAAQDLFHAPAQVIAFHQGFVPLHTSHPLETLPLGERPDVWQPPKRA